MLNQRYEQYDMSPSLLPVEWAISRRPVPYDAALAFMEQRVLDIHNRQAGEMVWSLEHPSLYTFGTSAVHDDLLDKKRFPVYQSGRGGQYTYHGPGQRIVYLMLNLKNRKTDVRAYVYDLEEWLIRTLSVFGVSGRRRDKRIGLWIDREGRDEKIVAIGIRIRRWIAFHGIALNVDVDLSPFDGIIPCGIREHGVTSLKQLGITCTMDKIDVVLRQKFEEVFQRNSQETPAPF